MSALPVGLVVAPAAVGKFEPPVKVTIVSAETASPPEKYTNYLIEVKASGMVSVRAETTWTVRRRFRQFFALHEQLKTRQSFKVVLPEAPQKKVIGAKTAEFIEERKGLLQAYLDCLTAFPPIFEDDAFCQFLELQPRTAYFERGEKAGVLYKQGKWNPSWKRRWCLLKDGYIFYFRGEKDSKPVGTIPLEGCTIAPNTKREFSFGIHHPRGRSFLLAADDDKSLNEWMTALQTPEETKVSLADFTMLTVLGKGSFGKVLRVRRNATGELFAMKVLRKDAVRAQHQVEHTRTERQLLQRVKHPFLVELKFAFQTDDKLYMVLDYVQGGELFTHLKKEKRFPQERARFYAGEVTLAIGYLHTIGFIYRDLKPENLLLDVDGHIKLTDFGLSKNVSGAKVSERATYTFCGTPEYMAPEVLTEQGHGKAVDWWSLGILIYEMIVGLPPFYSKNKREMYFKILKSDPRYPGFVTAEARDILSKLLRRNPSERLGAGSEDAQVIKEHAFFDGLDWSLMIQRKLPAPFVPVIREEGDTSNFDPAFTGENPDLSPTNPSQLSAAADEFDGFTFMPKNPMALAAAAEDEGEADERGERERGVDQEELAAAMRQVELEEGEGMFRLSAK